MPNFDSLRVLATRFGRFAAPLIWLLPDRVHFGRDYTALREFLTRAFDPKEYYAHCQSLLAEALLNAARTDYWEKTIHTQTEPLDTLKAQAILTRPQLSSNKDSMVSSSSRHLTELISTSGSSGSAISFWLDKRRRATEWAYTTNLWRTVGFEPKNWRVVFRGYSKLRNVTFESNAVQRELRISAGRGYDEELFSVVVDSVAKGKIRFLSGYPSSIALFAKFCMKQKISLDIDGVILVSEPLLEQDLHSMNNAWPKAAITAHYGLSEKCAFATATNLLAGEYVFDSSYGLVEILDEDGHPVRVGQRGKIIATRLKFQASSLLRYETGDTAVYLGGEWGNLSCPIRVRDIRPRREPENLECEYGCEHPVSTLIQTQSHFFDTHVNEYLIFNQSPGQVVFKFTNSFIVDQNQIDKFVKELQLKLGPHFVVDAVQVSDIQLTQTGKRQLVYRG